MKYMALQHPHLEPIKLYRLIGRLWHTGGGKSLHWAESLLNSFPQTEAGVQNLFSQPSQKEKPCGPRCTFEFFESIASPSGGFLPEKKRAALAWPQRLIQDAGRKTTPLPTLCPQCSQCHSGVTFANADMCKQPGSLLDRCQMGMKESDLLINLVYLGTARQTDSLHFGAEGDFLKVSLISNEQCHITGCGRAEVGC